MNDQAPIVVNIDARDEVESLIPKAVFFAKGLGAPLHLLSVLYDPYIAGERFDDGDDLSSVRELALEHERSDLDQLAEQYAQPGVSIEAVSVWGNPSSQVVCQYLKEQGAQLLIVGTHRPNKLGRALFRYGDWSLLRDAPCSVLSVVAPSYEKPVIVSVAVDPLHRDDKPASLDRQLVREGKQIASFLGGDVHLVHAVDNINNMIFAAAPGGVPMTVDDKALQEQIFADHQRAVNELASEAKIAADNTHVAEGSPVQSLKRLLVELESDLIVLGVMARGRVKEVFIGNTAERLIRYLDADLLLVKPESSNEIADVPRPSVPRERSVGAGASETPS